jgi:hypothetical protein
VLDVVESAVAKVMNATEVALTRKHRAMST